MESRFSSAIVQAGKLLFPCCLHTEPSEYLHQICAYQNIMDAFLSCLDFILFFSSNTLTHCTSCSLNFDYLFITFFVAQLVHPSGGLAIWQGGQMPEEPLEL